jgi:hypothetical protein
MNDLQELTIVLIIVWKKDSLETFWYQLRKANVSFELKVRMEDIGPLPEVDESVDVNTLDVMASNAAYY